MTAPSYRGDRIMGWYATPYTYANGTKAFGSGRYQIMINTGTEKDPYYRGIGGVRLFKKSGLILAWVGPTGIREDKEIRAYAAAYVEDQADPKLSGTENLKRVLARFKTDPKVIRALQNR